MISRKIARIVTSCERPFVGLEDVLENFLFARGGEDFAALIGLHLADLPGDRGPLVDELEDLQVELVDLDAQCLQVAAAWRTCRTAVGLARHVQIPVEGCWNR